MASEDEGSVERHLMREVKKLRGLCIKIRFMLGWPDRLVLLPGGVLLFVELKRPKGGKYEVGQLRRHASLRALGFRVGVCHTKDSVDTFLQGLL